MIAVLLLQTRKVAATSNGDYFPLPRRTKRVILRPSLVVVVAIEV
jgi:hypothetical protein